MNTCILFDLDGTVLDTLQDLTDSVNHALTHFGYPARTDREIRSFLGFGARQLIASALPEGADCDPVFECYTEWYKDHSRIKTRPYPGIPEVLEALGSRYAVGVVSNKPDPATKALIKEYFGTLYALGQREDIPKKPAPDMLYRAMRELGAERCVYVGDSEVDIFTAQNAGVPCISVTWGFRDRDFLESSGARYLCHSADQLPALIEKALCQ